MKYIGMQVFLLISDVLASSRRKVGYINASRRSFLFFFLGILATGINRQSGRLDQHPAM